MPTAVPIQWVLATAPNVPRISGRVVKRWFGRVLIRYIVHEGIGSGQGIGMSAKRQRLTGIAFDDGFQATPCRDAVRAFRVGKAVENGMKRSLATP